MREENFTFVTLTKLKLPQVTVNNKLPYEHVHVMHLDIYTYVYKINMKNIKKKTVS